MHQPCKLKKSCFIILAKSNAFRQTIHESEANEQSLCKQFSLFMHPDQAQNALSGIQGQEATAVAVIYVTAPTSSRKTSKYK